MEPSESSQHLSSDSAQTDPHADRLGYAPFAKMLAHSALRGSPAAGLVVGIYGEWGLGKTTLLNFVEHYAKTDADDDDPIIVRFNPWWFSGREDLLRRFFKEFETAVLRKGARNKKLRSGLQKLGEAVGTMPHAMVASVGKVLAAATKFGEPADLVGLKEAIGKSLAEEALRVIVLVDDIDRLMPAEMVDVFRLVRSVGDFSNVHYVLAFDRQVVANALTTQIGTDGARYLEKIVQVPFELPRPSPTTLYGLFARGLAPLLVGTEESLLEQRHTADLLMNGVGSFLRTPRDVARLTNALLVTYPPLKNEVNPADFVAIEALRIFAPDVYECIRSNRSRFVGPLLAAQHMKKENLAFHSCWFEASSSVELTVRGVVLKMFPAVASLHSGGYKGNDREHQRARRICSDPMFERYFRYSLGGSLSRAEFQDCMELRGEPLHNRLRSLAEEQPVDGQRKLRSFLDMIFDDLLGGVAVSPDLLPYLFGVGDRVVAGTSRAFDFSAPDDMLLVFVIEKLLERLPLDARTGVLRAGLACAGVCFSAMVVTMLGAQHGRHGEPAVDPAERTIPVAADIDGLEEEIRERLASSCIDGSLWTAPNLLRLLFDWKRVGSGSEMRRAVQSWTAEDAKFLELLGLLLGASSSGRHVVDLEALSELLEIEPAVERAERLLASSGLPPGGRASLKALVQGYSETEPQRREGRTRRLVLLEILRAVSESGTFPTRHSIRQRFEAERALIDRMERDLHIASTWGDRYLVRVEGLRQLGFEPTALRELEVCRLLLEKLKASYRDNKRSVELAQFAEESRGEAGAPSEQDLRRAALVLLSSVNVAKSTFNIVTGPDGEAASITSTEAILEVSLAE